MDLWTVARFWSKVEKSADGCWIWTGARNKQGYGSLQLQDGRVGKAHRISYEIHKGEIPAGLEPDHTCRIRACVNPAHLEAVTHQENCRRKYVPRTTCIRGHEYTPENTVVITRSDNGRPKRCCKACWRFQFHARKGNLEGRPYRVAKAGTGTEGRSGVQPGRSSVFGAILVFLTHSAAFAMAVAR